MQEPQGASAPQQQPPNEMELDDDELLDMMGDMQPEPCLDSGLPVSASMQPPLNDTLEGDFHAWSLDLCTIRPVPIRLPTLMFANIPSFACTSNLAGSSPCVVTPACLPVGHMHADLLSKLTQLAVKSCIWHVEWQGPEHPLAVHDVMYTHHL